MQISKEFLREIADRKLTVTQYRILILLWTDKPKTAAQITKELGTAHVQNILKPLKELEKLGYITVDRIEGRNRFLKAVMTCQMNDKE